MKEIHKTFIADSIQKLRAYCHKNGCKTLHQCPYTCCRKGLFKKRMDLDTAMVWRAADVLSQIVHSVSAREIKFFLNEGLIVLRNLRCATFFHRNKYKRLYELLREIEAYLIYHI